MEIILLLATVIFCEMMHKAFISRVYMEIRDDLFHRNKKLRRRSILYRTFFTAILCWLGSMWINPLVVFGIVSGVRLAIVGSRLFHYRKAWFRTRVTMIHGLSDLVALLYTLSLAGAVTMRNPWLLLGILPAFPMGIWLDRIKVSSFFQIYRDVYDIDLETARRYVQRHDAKMERRYGEYFTKAAQCFGLNREMLKREIMMECMVRQSFSYMFFESFARLLPAKFPYPEGKTIGLAQASARLAKKSLNLEKLPLRDLLKPDVQIMAAAYHQAEILKEYEENPQLAENRILYMVCRYTGTGVHAKHIWNTGVFVEILKEGEAKSQYVEQDVQTV